MYHIVDFIKALHICYQFFYQIIIHFNPFYCYDHFNMMLTHHLLCCQQINVY